jgi:putative transposase
MTKEATPLNTDLIDQLLKDYHSPEDVLGENGLLKQLTKAVLERAMQAELTHHLGYSKHSPAGNKSGNSRNGKSRKTLKGEFGSLPIDVPRDRSASFEPQIVPKHQTRFEGFDDKILSLYASGMTTRQIQQHLEEIYGVEVSPSLISTVTDAVLDEVRAWQSRPLEAVYVVVYFDCLRVKIRDGAQVITKAVYLALGLTREGQKEALGLWISPTEGAKLWMGVMSELKNRGVTDIFIACVDGLKGLPEAIEAVFPQVQVQQCIVHQLRASLSYVGYKERKAVATDLKAVYTAPTREAGQERLEEFALKWDADYPTISKAWRLNWERLAVFYNYPPEIRKVIYTTNAIESVNDGLRRVIKNRGAFPNDEAALKLLYLALENLSRKWTMPVKDWRAAMNQLAILFEGRWPLV